jgi:hypothetical protein
MTALASLRKASEALTEAREELLRAALDGLSDERRADALYAAQLASDAGSRTNQLLDDLDREAA